MKTAKLLFLGTGASAGIPMVGCYCAVCGSKSVKNKRLRPSVLVSIANKRLLIDIGPDFRRQALGASIDSLDGLLLTHTHYDHIAGIDELRCFYILHKKRIPVLLSGASFEELKKRYDYLIDKREQKGLSAQLDFHLLPNVWGKYTFQGVEINYFSYRQAMMEVNGFRFGRLAYVSDIQEYQESLFQELEDLDVLIVSALRHNFSPMHFTVEEALHFASRVDAKRTYFMHISHEIDHDTVQAELPKGVFLAYDGLEIEWDYDRD